MAEYPKTISFLYLSQDDVLKVGLTMAEAMDLCAQSFTEHAHGKVENPPKPGVHPLPDAFIHAMPGIYKV
jgi:ornithine cyclodeaminase/alanine dehydrogenase-like protein (mu-crystallin family)